MNLLRGFLLLGWLLLMAISYHAINTLGLDSAKVFFDDFAHAWRAQFYTDFLLHVLPITAWVFWREQSKLTGLLCAIGTTFGGVFTLLYLFITTFREQGDIRRVLLGKHYKI